MHSNVDLLKGNIIKGLMIFALPIFISNIFQQLYNTVDTMIVGNFLGDTSLAAIGACTAVYELLIGFALGIGNGLSIVVARFYGANDTQKLKKSVAGSIVIGIGVSLIIMMFSLFLLFPLLQLLNTPTAIINEAYSYISFVTLFVFVMFAYNLCAGLLRAIGNSFMPLVFLIISSLLNIGLDLLFITQYNMGVRGAAIATVIAQLVSVIFCIVYIIKKAPLLIPNKEHFRFDQELYQELAGQGFSMGFMMSIVSSGTVILQSSINNLGYLTIAAHTSARKIQSFCTMPVNAFGMALGTFVSQNKGANQRDRIIKGIRFTHIYVICVSIILAILLYFVSPTLIHWISGSQHQEVIETGASYLRINAPFYAVLGILINLRTSLQGLGKKIVPLISSIIEFFGKMIFTILFIPSLGYFGVTICEPVIWVLMTIQLAFAFYNNPYIKDKAFS